jgi:hypothetical protein
MSGDIKQFLYSWCGKQHLTPTYDFSQINTKHAQRFKCEVRVGSYNYIGIGNSTNKKDAQSNAALDFCQFLVRSGSLNQNDLPMANVIRSLVFFLAFSLNHYLVSLCFVRIQRKTQKMNHKVQAIRTCQRASWHHICRWA